MSWLVGWLIRALRLLGLGSEPRVHELDVVGADCLTIELGDHTRVVEAYFVEDGCHALPPCGGGLPDQLSWEVIRGRHGHRRLKLCWDVNRPRQVVVVTVWR